MVRGFDGVLRKRWSYALMTADPVCRLVESVAIQAVLSYTEIEDE